MDHEIERPLTEFFKNSSIALALAKADSENHLVLVNEQFTKLTGYNNADVVGKNCRLLQTSPRGLHAENDDAKATIRAFLQPDGPAAVRTPIVNFRKDEQAFVNLLFMSKLTSAAGKISYILASQFDVSRTHPEFLKAYDVALGDALSRLKPLLDGHNVLIEGTLATIANSTSTIAQAKLTLAGLETSSPY